MNYDINIYQLDKERQVLSILAETGDYLSIEQIKCGLLNKEISPDAGQMRSFLSATLGDKRKKFVKYGLVHKKSGKIPQYKIMQKGFAYLENTVIVIDPLNDSANHEVEALNSIFANLVGDIKLCDPYFDNDSYKLLNNNLNHKNIRSLKILYSRNRLDAQKNKRIGNTVVEYEKRKNLLHDRFLIDNKKLYFLGASLNGFGAKLSFIIDLTIHREKFIDVFNDYWTSK